MLGAAACADGGSMAPAREATPEPPRRPPQVAARYPVHYGRELRDGESFRATVRVSSEREWRWRTPNEPDAVLLEHADTLFEGTCRVLGVDESGRPSHLRLGVYVFRHRTDEGSSRLPEGVEIEVAWAPGDTGGAVRVAGEPPPTVDLYDAIVAIAGPAGAGSPTGDALRSLEPRVIGETWHATLTAFDTHKGLVIRPRDETATVRLIGVQDTPLGDIREIQLDAKATNLLFDGFADSFRVGPGTHHRELTGMVQPDGFVIGLQARASTRVEARLPGEGGGVGRYRHEWALRMSRRPL